MKLCIECRAAFDSEDWHCPACGFVPEMVGDWPTFRSDLVGTGPKEFGNPIYERMMAFEERSFYTRARLRLIRWAIEKFFPGLTNFYDFGAGTGFVIECVRAMKPDLDLYASDLSFDALSWVDSRLGGNVTLFHTDADHIPYFEHFDVVGAFDVIEHIDDDVAALGALYRAIKPGGGILITVPRHMIMWSPLDDEAGHKRRYCGNELARKVGEAGFQVIWDSCFMATLFLPQLLSRRLLTRFAGRQSFESENMLPTPINGLLEGVLSIELALLRLGLRFPFGGTQIVAARKS